MADKTKRIEPSPALFVGQGVVALARLSNGEFRYAQTEVVVTESACLDAG